MCIVIMILMFPAILDIFSPGIRNISYGCKILYSYYSLKFGGIYHERLC